MKCLTKYILVLTLLLPSGASSETSVNVVSDIKPVNSLVLMIVQGVATSDVIIGSGSAHHYHLTPSVARKIADADVIFWTGPEMIVGLNDVIQDLSSPSVTVVSLLAETEHLLLPRRELQEFFDDEEEHEHGHKHEEAHDDHHDEHGHEHEEAHDDHHDEHGHEHEEAHDDHHDEHGHEHEEAHDDHHDEHGHEHEEAHDDHHDEHGHEHEEAHDDHHDEHEHGHEEAHDDHHDEHGHEHEEAHDDHHDEHEHGHDHEHFGFFDPHAWLDPSIALEWLKIIKDTLVEADPEHKSAYEANFSRWSKVLIDLDSSNAARLSNIDPKFIVYHDAYQYFENRYGLEPLVAFLDQHGRISGARHISRSIEQYGTLEESCILVEPISNPNLIATVAKGSNVELIKVDPAGSNLEDGPNLYIELINALVDGLVNCPE